MADSSNLGPRVEALRAVVEWLFLAAALRAPDPGAFAAQFRAAMAQDAAAWRDAHLEAARIPNVDIDWEFAAQVAAEIDGLSQGLAALADAVRNVPRPAAEAPSGYDRDEPAGIAPPKPGNGGRTRPA